MACQQIGLQSRDFIHSFFPALAALHLRLNVGFPQLDQYSYPSHQRTELKIRRLAPLTKT